MPTKEMTVLKKKKEKKMFWFRVETIGHRVAGWPIRRTFNDTASSTHTHTHTRVRAILCLFIFFQAFIHIINDVYLVIYIITDVLYIIVGILFFSFSPVFVKYYDMFTRYSRQTLTDTRKLDNNNNNSNSDRVSGKPLKIFVCLSFETMWRYWWSCWEKE